MSIWSKFQAVIARKHINKQIDTMLSNQDTLLHACDALGDQLGLFFRCVMKATIEQADAQRETTIDFYIKNESAIKKIVQGVELLATKENADIIVKSYKDTLKAIVDELDAQEDSVRVEQNATAIEKVKDVLDQLKEVEVEEC